MFHDTNMRSRARAHTHAYAHTHTHTLKGAHTLTHIHTHKHERTHTHTHTHQHTRLHPDLHANTLTRIHKHTQSPTRTESWRSCPPRPASKQPPCLQVVDTAWYQISHAPTHLALSGLQLATWPSQQTQACFVTYCQPTHSHRSAT